VKATTLEWLFRVCIIIIVFIVPFTLWGVDFGGTCMAMGIPVVLDFRPLFYAEFTGASWLNWMYALGIGVTLACAIIILLIFEYYEEWIR